MAYLKIQLNKTIFKKTAWKPYNIKFLAGKISLAIATPRSDKILLQIDGMRLKRSVLTQDY